MIPAVRPRTISAFEPELPGFAAAWAASFECGRHVYGFRIEEVREVPALNHDAFCAEQRIQGDGSVYIAKFDNILNSIVTERAYMRLPPSDRLTMRELRELPGLLLGGLAEFVEHHAPRTIVGLPNDTKLCLWYQHLVRRAALPGYTAEMRATSYHVGPILLIYRAD